MSADPSVTTDRLFVVVLLGSGACRFRPREQVRFRYYTGDGRQVSIRFGTRYAAEGLQSDVPRETVCVVELFASDIASAAEQAARHANVTGALIGVATNAAFDILQPTIVYERHAVNGRRGYFQSHREMEVGLPRRTRPVASEQLLTLLGAITRSPESERLVRAATHYNLALQSWRPGAEALAVTPVWMAAETLTPVALRSELARAGLDDAGLAASWGIQIAGSRGSWRTALTAEVRRRLIFHGDSATHRAAKRASDGWEHGFLGFEEVRSLAIKSRSQTAKCVRDSIFELSGIASLDRDTFLVPSLSEPADYFPYARYVRGWLVGDHDEPAPTDALYPSINWSYRLQRFELVTDDAYAVGFEDSFALHIADGLMFQAVSIEVWGPRSASRSGRATEESG